MVTCLKALAALAVAGMATAAPSEERNHHRNGTWAWTTTAGNAPTRTSDPFAVSNTATTSADVAAAAATAKTLSPTSNVEGKAFNRILQIYLETTIYDNVINNTDCKALFDQGILLTKEYGVGAPSQPAYVAAASGDYYGTNSDSFLLVDRNVSTIVDLLEERGISWGDYNEGLPYSGFDGFEYSNPVEGNYSRKHNLLVRFESIFENEDRLAKVKNLTMFYNDLEKQQLPQWGFVTPNLYDNGHDTNISVSCKWTRDFVTPLLGNAYFNDGKTVIYITWQANGQVPTAPNHVAGILLGSGIPSDMIGTTDDNYYNHYSELASVEANWGLHTLGRWDVGANVWKFVAQKTGDVIRSWNDNIAGDSFQNYYWNQSYGGVFSSDNISTHVYPAPNLELVRNSRTVLPAIAQAWAGECGSFPSRGGNKPFRRARRARRDGGGCSSSQDDGDYDEEYHDSHHDDSDDGDDWWNHVDGSGDGNGDGNGDGHGDGHGNGNGNGNGGGDDGGNGGGNGNGGGDGNGNGNGGQPDKYCLPDYYRDIIEIPDAAHPPKGFEVPVPLQPAEPIQTPITAYPI